jgi:hypothetical protein
MEGIRIIVAVLALELDVSKRLASLICVEGVNAANIAAIPRMPATAAFVRRFIFRFQTRKIGKVPRVKSVTMQIALRV